MFRICKRSAMITIASTALALSVTTGAMAAPKKLTYEQAWAHCKADIVAALPGETTTSAARYTRGAACMKQHGYRLKRSSLQ
jgi:hypothetical protein